MNREIYTLYMIANIGPNLSTKEWVDNNELFLQLATKVVKEINEVFLYNFSEVLNRIYLLNHSNIDVLEEFANKIQDTALKEDVEKLKQWISLYKEKQPHFTIKDLETVFHNVGFRFNYDLKGVYQLYYKYAANEDDDKQLLRAILYPFVFIKQYQIALELIISLNMIYQDWVNGKNAKFVLPMLVGYLDRLYTVFKSIPNFWRDNKFKKLYHSWQIAVSSNSKKIMFQYLLPEFRKFIKEHALKKKGNSHIESYHKMSEFKPKKLDDETIFSMLVNLYAGITMLQSWRLDKEDKETLQFILFYDYITPIIQSIFYDTIKHYQEEISEFKETLVYYYTILGALNKLVKPDFLKKLQEKNAPPEKIEHLEKSLTHVLHYFVSSPCYKSLKKLATSIPQKLQSDSTSFTIDEWVGLMKQIPPDIWKNFSECIKKIGDNPMMGLLADILIEINYYFKDFDVFKLVNINAFIYPFLYFDEPYYSAFYNSLLSLYQQYNICKTHLTFDNLQKLVLMLDHIKDLQHHSNFFWISISKRTMDFISNTKTLKDLIPNVTDPDILRIYRKYKYVYNENLFNKSIYIQLLEGLKGEKIYPKKANSEQLKHYLANMYLGEYLLHNVVNNEKDKKVIAFETYYSGVLPVIQSIFYDTIEHYKEEAKGLLINYDRLEHFQFGLEDIFLQMTDDMEKKGVDREVIRKISQQMDKVLDEVGNLPCLDKLQDLLGVLFVDYEDNYYNAKSNISLNEPIENWINLIKQIDRNEWEEFSTICKDKVYLLVDKIDSIFSLAGEFGLRDYRDDIDISTPAEPFFFFDTPYYKAFYNNLLPLYETFEKYRQTFASNLLDDLILQIDHIKDLRHHNDFFWISLKKEDMDFIKNAKVKELYQVATSSTLKKIYKQYRGIIQKEDLDLLPKDKILIESLQTSELKPKKATNEQLKHYLANMYLGYHLLTSKQLDNEDRKLVIYETYNSGVLPVIQSIFYDSIKHYNQEIADFVSLGSKGIDINYISEEVDRFLNKMKKEVNKEEYLKLKKEVEWIKNNLKECLDVPNKIINSIWKWVDAHGVTGDIYSFFDKNPFNTVDEWIKFLSSIPRKEWRDFAESSYTCIDTIYESFPLLAYIVEHYDEVKDIDTLYDLMEEDKEETLYLDEDYYTEILSNTTLIFQYFDEPYYNNFYNDFLPLYNEIKEFQHSLNISVLEKIIMRIDHIKDLRHHSDVFWTSLQKDTMDYISQSKSLSQLYQWATNNTIKSIYKKYRKLLGESLDLLLKGKILIESLKINELKPKKATNEQLEGYLANLYMGLLLLYENIENSDKQIIQKAVWDSGVLPIVQSIYYDTIGHYIQEMQDFVDRVKVYKNAVTKVNSVIEKLSDDLEKEGYNLEDDSNVSSEELDEYWYFVDEVRTSLDRALDDLEGEEAESMYRLSDEVKDCLEDLGVLHNKTIEIKNIPIEKWIKCMLSLSRDNWRQYVKGVGHLQSAVGAIYSAFDYAQRYQDYPYLENLEFGGPFYYMDDPYYYPFYNVFLPFWELIKSYQEKPKLQLLKQISQGIDYIKDLQHHSDFFWTSLQTETMDFISHAKVSELIKYVTDSDIRNLYKKYRFIFWGK